MEDEKDKVDELRLALLYPVTHYENEGGARGGKGMIVIRSATLLADLRVNLIRKPCPS